MPATSAGMTINFNRRHSGMRHSVQAGAPPLQRCVVLILRSALLRASRRMATWVHPAILRDAAEFFIGPRFARTRWRLLRMRAEHDAAPSIFVMAGLRRGIHVFLGR